MKRRALVAAFVSFVIVSSSSCSLRREYLSIEGYAQGGIFHVTYSMPKGGKDCVPAIEDSVRSVLLLLDGTFSGYNHGSLIAKVNDAETCEPLEVNEAFADLFARSYVIWRESGGAFDPTGAPLFDVWGFGFKQKEKVTDALIDSLKCFIGMEKVRIDTVFRDGVRRFMLVKSDPRIKLNFNAVAQGYASDCIARVLDRFGVENYLVDIGEITCRGVNAEGNRWRIGIERPEDGNQERGKSIQMTINVTDCGVVTSGNYRKYYVENGKKFSHSIDPRSGRPVNHNLLSATVVAKDGTTADACSTWFMVVGLDEAVKIIKSWKGLKAVLIYDEGGVFKIWSNVTE